MTKTEDRILLPSYPDSEHPVFSPLLEDCAFLLDIDGTLRDRAPTPLEVVGPPGLADAVSGLHMRTDGALALGSGRALADIDHIFAPMLLPAVGGHGAEMRLSVDNEAVAAQAPPKDKDLKKRFTALGPHDPRIIIEDKGYSIALHYRQAPNWERSIFDAVSAIRADLPEAPIDVLPGKSVCEIKNSGISKATGVKELLKHEPFAGRRPIFIGDDVTDESVFAIMPDLKGISFSVCRYALGVDGFFPEPADGRHWLASLLDGSESV